MVNVTAETRAHFKNRSVRSEMDIQKDKGINRYG